MTSAAPMLPLLAIVAVAVLTFLYTVANAIERQEALDHLTAETRRLQDEFARRRAAMEAGTLPGMKMTEDELSDDEVTVLDPGLSAGGSRQAA